MVFIRKPIVIGNFNLCINICQVQKDSSIIVSTTCIAITCSFLSPASLNQCEFGRRNWVFIHFASLFSRIMSNTKYLMDKFNCTECTTFTYPITLSIIHRKLYLTNIQQLFKRRHDPIEKTIIYVVF